VTIDAVDGQMRPVAVSPRPVTEGKILLPFVTDSDVFVVSVDPGALPHADPDVVETGSRFAVPVVTLGDQFAIVATARRGVGPQVGPRSDDLLAAGAPAAPMRVFISVFEGNDGEPSEGFANHLEILDARGVASQ